MKKRHKTYLILHNIRSSHNVGSIFRTADALGIDTLFLSGYTPRPINRFGQVNTRLAKTALGAEQSLPWRYTQNVALVIQKLQQANVAVVAVEQTPHSIDYKKYRTRSSLALLFGNEVRGLSKALLKKTDACIEIPMRGAKESLNVSVAVGIVAFRLCNQ